MHPVETQSIALATAPTYTLTNMESVKQLAKDLQEFVNDSKLTTPIQGKNYVNVEGWQACGGMLGIFPFIINTENLSQGTEYKYGAEVELRRASDGSVVGTAYAVCSNKESRKKSFDEYAICSMAQTRAVGKAFRTMLSWVMKMAGFEPTPAEEMDFATKQEMQDELKAAVAGLANCHNIEDFAVLLEGLTAATANDPDFMNATVIRAIQWIEATVKPEAVFAIGQGMPTFVQKAAAFRTACTAKIAALATPATTEAAPEASEDQTAGPVDTTPETEPAAVIPPTAELMAMIGDCPTHDDLNRLACRYVDRFNDELELRDAQYKRRSEIDAREQAAKEPYNKAYVTAEEVEAALESLTEIAHLEKLWYLNTEIITTRIGLKDKFTAKKKELQTPVNQQPATLGNPDQSLTDKWTKIFATYQNQLQLTAAATEYKEDLKNPEVLALFTARSNEIDALEAGKGEEQPQGVTPAGSGDSAIELDTTGLPWDERIHSSAKTQASGLWRRKRGINDLEFTEVEKELRAAGYINPKEAAPAPDPEKMAAAKAALETPPAPEAQKQDLKWFQERIGKEVWMQGPTEGDWSGRYMLEDEGYPDYCYNELQNNGNLFRDVTAADPVEESEQVAA